MNIPSISQFLQAVCNAISLGSIYALVAIGYTMVYGILKLINFAHCDLMMMSMYFAFYTVAFFTFPWWAAFLVSIILTALLGLTTERVAYRPLRSAPRISVLIAAIGMSYLLENLAVVLFTGIPKSFQEIPALQDSFLVGEVSIQKVTIVAPIVAAILVYTLLRIVNKTKLGMAMRAVSFNFQTSRLMGINVDKVITLTFLIGSALAAVGGLFWMTKYPKMDPYVGAIPGLKCFIASVLGGIGNIAGAVVGAAVLAFIEIMIVLFFPAISGYKDAFAFVILILVLLFKPTGLLGEIGGSDKA